ncbi:putative insulin receptor substrate 1 [Apostichopus japonicus]|uniref:Putative insulin receptor substrate 1 n=1 Tax=Stichopus japonicus TaxID=307972 RepID=A0A2G8JIV7_STIJA|nr:putative insulin receptor substrate 1 [Apostichopus japonicus]
MSDAKKVLCLNRVFLRLFISRFPFQSSQLVFNQGAIIIFHPLLRTLYRGGSPSTPCHLSSRISRHAARDEQPPWRVCRCWQYSQVRLPQETQDHEKEILCYLGSHQHNLSSFGVLRQREEVSPGFRGKKSILLSTCFNINRKSDMKNKYVIALYTRDDYFAIVTEDEEQQNEWLRVLLEQQRASGDGRPIPHFEHIWQVTVKSKGLGSSQNLSGNYRLCLTAGTINLVKMNSENGDLQFPLSVVRRCGHSDCFFFMEVGRQAVTGSGEMWMQVEDSVIAQNIHEATLNAMRSSSQNEDMRPRSHSGGTSHSSSSWRMRCDSLPVGSSAGSRLSRTRGNSEGDDGTREDDYANPPSG